MTDRREVAGVVLAGGLARRMGGGDKPLRPIAGRAMLDRVVARLAPQVGALALNANGDPARFAEFDLPVIPDPVGGYAGPLAGVLAGLEWARDAVSGAAWVASAAGDTPFFPADLVDRFMDAAGGDHGTICLARTHGHVHPVFGLWPVALAADLRAFLEKGETRKVLAFVDAWRRVDVDFDPIDGADGPFDPFFNVNAPEDIDTAEAMAAALEGEAVG